jgi:hypothetical protein
MCPSRRENRRPDGDLRGAAGHTLIEAGDLIGDYEVEIEAEAIV